LEAREAIGPEAELFVDADGVIRPDLSRPGIGVELKRKDAERYL